MCAQQRVEDTTMWVPVCCGTVMRYNTFGAGDDSVAAFICNACGKNFALQPHNGGSIEEYGQGARVVAVVSVKHPARGAVKAATVRSDRDDTM